MSNGSEQGPWFWASVVAIVSTLAGAVSALYKKGRADASTRLRDTVAAHSEQIAQLRADHEAAMGEMRSDRDSYRQQAEECQRDRIELRERVARMDERLKTVELTDRSQD